MISNSSNLSYFDKSQALAHLKALGYTHRCPVFLGFIKAGHVGFRDKGKSTPDTLNAKEIEQNQRKGYDVYFVVNGGGDDDAAVTKCRAIFFEHDNLSKELQRELWKSLGLPEPTFQVDTGGKSIHSYWVFDQPISKEQWEPLQSDLLEYSDGDRVIKNPSRIMRLAGSSYMKGDKPGTTQARIISNSGKRYTYEELRKAVPPITSAPAPAPSLKFEPSTNDAIPLYQCLSKDDRALIDNGTASDRNVSGARLARSIIGAAARLTYLGYRYEGDPYQLFIDYCTRCNQGDGWNQREWDSIWKSAQKDNPSATLTDDAIENCIKAWQRNQQKANKRMVQVTKAAGTASNVVVHPTAERITMTDDDIAIAIENLIAEGLSASKLQLAIATLAKDANRTERTISEAYKSRLVEIEQTESREETAAELESLQNAQNYPLEIEEILPEQLAVPIKQLATWMNLVPAAYLTTMLTTAASLNKVGTSIKVCNATDWYEPPQLYSGIVAASSQKKSPILRAMATRPLAQLQQEIKDNFAADMEDYEEEMKAWENCPHSDRREKFPDGQPIKPKLRRLSFTAGTNEGLFRQFQNNPEYGLLWNCDELAGLFKGANQYKGGKGDDIEAILSMYDGTPISLLRADETKNIDLVSCILSIMGTIQPTVLQRLMVSDEDGNGQWARFCWVLQPLAMAALPESGDLNLTPLIADLYRKIDDLKPTIYKLSPLAWKKFRAEYNRLEEKRIEAATKSSGLSSCYGKSGGRLARIALNLHIIWELAEGRIPGEFISLETMQRAAKLNRFYLAQVRSLYSEFHGEESIAPDLLKVLELSQKKGGWIKANAVAQSITQKRRPSSEVVRGWFAELVLMGKGVVRGSGRNVDFSALELPVDQKIDENRRKIDESSIFETIDTHGFQDKNRQIDKIDDFAKNLEEEQQQQPTQAIDDLDYKPETNTLESSISSICLFSGSNPDGETVSKIDDVSIELSISSILDETEAIAPPETELQTQTQTEEAISPAPDELAEETEPQQATKLKVGDRVKVYRPGHKTHGLEGIILEFKVWEPCPYLVGLEAQAGAETLMQYRVKEEWIERLGN